MDMEKSRESPEALFKYFQETKVCNTLSSVKDGSSENEKASIIIEK